MQTKANVERLSSRRRPEVWVCALVCTLASAVFAEQPGAGRLESVEKLLETSSAAHRIEQSGNADAQARHEQARALLAQAKQAAASGDQTAAGRLLEQATRTMFDAVRMIEKDQSLIDKTYSDYDARLASITALCEAYDRISREKGLGPGKSSELYPLVHGKLDQAAILRKEGKPVEGRKLLDEAYVAAKVGIEHLRGGDTLVRSLNFASKEEEYRYEIDRNDTHRMLVDILLKDKMQGDSNVTSTVTKFLARAAELRAQAERQAAAGDHAGAVSTLEASTREIVRAIRSAGVYIPG